MKHADPKDFNEVYSLFRKNRMWFPHIRTDKLKEQIESGLCVFDRGGVITYHINQRKNYISKNSKVMTMKGDCILHQIVAEKSDGSASNVFDDFFDYISTNLYLSVREDNERAVRFYYKKGMEKIGETMWGKENIKGLVFRKSPVGLMRFVDS